MSVPYWALSLAYWVHMVATVIWIGGLAGLSFFVLPVASKSLDLDNYSLFLDRVQRRLDPIAWFSLVALAGTGLIQMSANPNYKGFLTIQDRWAVSIFLKHLLFLGMVCFSAYLSWGVMPKLRRIVMRMSKVKSEQESDSISMLSVRLQRQETALLRLNLILGILILALTSLARAV